MRRAILILGVIAALLTFVVPPVSAAGPDCAGGEIKFFTHWYQSGLMGHECLTTNGTKIASDSNFGDNLDAFRTVDNNDADSWEFWSQNSSYEHCLILADGTNLSTPIWWVTLYSGGTHYWGNLPAGIYNRTTSYSVIQVAVGSNCGA